MREVTDAISFEEFMKCLNDPIPHMKLILRRRLETFYEYNKNIISENEDPSYIHNVVSHNYNLLSNISEMANNISNLSNEKPVSCCNGIIKINEDSYLAYIDVSGFSENFCVVCSKNELVTLKLKLDYFDYNF